MRLKPMRSTASVVDGTASEASEMAPGAQKCYAETWLILERQHDGFMTLNILNVLSCYHAVIFMVVNSEVYIVCFTELYILLWRARAWSIYPYLSIYLST